MRQKDERERTENARARSNRHILWLTYGIAALFIAILFILAGLSSLRVKM